MITSFDYKDDFLQEDVRVKYYELSDDMKNPFFESYDIDDIKGFFAEVMDQDQFIKKNPTSCKEVTNPVFFVKNGVPTPDGLLSNELFGITKEERSGTYGYIDLHGTYIDPSCYKAWIKLDPKVKNIVHGTMKYIVNEKGEFEEDEDNGEYGIDFLKKSVAKLKFKSNGSNKREIKIKYLQENLSKNRVFISKCFVIPPFYRDVNTEESRIGVGEINKIYAQIIALSQSQIESDYYGLSKMNANAGRVQELILRLYDWFCGNNNNGIAEPGVGLSGKKGLIKRAVMSKTSDYSSRVVISAPDLSANKREDIPANLDRVVMPLAMAVTDFFPYIVFNMSRFFQNEFSDYAKYPVLDKSGEVKYVDLKNPNVEFSEERIIHELHKYLHGYSDRLIPIEIPIEDNGEGNGPCYMMFKGRGKEPDEAHETDEPIYQRRLTWTDVIYRAAVESCRDKMCLITRYPMDSRHNQFPCGILVGSTQETEMLEVGGVIYKYYPKIREEDIKSDTSSMFIDTLVMSNLYLPAIGGDYDGDTITAKGVYTVEANEELKVYANSKANYMDLGGQIIRTPNKEALISLYVMTMIPDNTKMIDPIF